jgi:hypothetical protein
MIRGIKVALVPGMSYQEAPGEWCSPGCSPSTRAWYLEYDPNPGADDGIDSWLVFDEDYHLLQNEILIQHRDVFKPILEALNPPYDPFASAPAYLFIKGRQIPLAPGMTYHSGGTTICEGARCPSGVFTEVQYDSKPEEAGWSWLVFDEGYALRGSHIRPEDQWAFQPMLDAFAAQ